AVAEAGWRLEDVDRVVTHQANARITAAVAEELALQPARVLGNIDRVGNTSSASVPLLLADAAAEGQLLPGHRVLVCAFGAGLTWGATTLVWPEIGPWQDTHLSQQDGTHD